MNQPPKIETMPVSVPAWTLTPPAPEDLWEEDGVPLETFWHRLAMNLLIESVSYLWRDRTDFYVGGNMFIYYSAEQAKNKDYRGPDFFFVWGTDRLRLRKYWYIWEENFKFPNVIIELISDTTADMDRNFKKAIYEKTFQTPEYFLYDPDTTGLEGWRLNSARNYQAIHPDENGWLWSEQLQLRLGRWTGSYLEMPGIYPRFYDANGNLVLIRGEAEEIHAETERQRADTQQRRAEQEQLAREQEKQRAEQEKQRAEQEKQRAEQERTSREQERQRAEKEKERAEALAAELAALKAKLAELEGKDKPAS